MARENELLELVGGIYEAGADPSHWPFLLSKLGTALESPFAGLVYHEFGVNSGAVAASSGGDPEGVQLYNTRYHALDPWVHGAQGAGLRVQTGLVMVGEEVISHNRLRTTEYYNEFADRYDAVRLLAGVVLREGPVFANLSLLRGEAGDPFGPVEKQSLTALMPHLQRAIAIHRRIDALTSLNAAATEAFDRVPFGVVLLDESGRVLFSNGEAHRILNEADAIRFGNSPSGRGAKNPHPHLPASKRPPGRLR